MRPARSDDPGVPGLLYLSAAPYYDAYAGSADRARRVLEALWPRPGHTASFEVTWVADEGGAPVGALAAFPAEDGDALARRFLSLSVPRMPFWCWPGVLRHLRASAEVTPVPPERTLYVDALAVERTARRRGVAGALLDEADRIAAQRGLRGVSLDTGLENHPARALYERRGFELRAEHHAPDDRVMEAVGGPGFASYFKPL